MTERARIIIEGDASQLSRTLKAAGDQLQKFGSDIQSRFASVRDQLGNLGNIVAVLGTARLTQFADDAALVTARLKDVTGSASGAATAQAQLFAMAQRLQVSYSDLAGSFSKMLPAVKAMGGGTAEASRLAEILTTSAKLSGASSAEAAASSQQFAQALQSGVLQGDELKSILENNGTLARLLADGLGVSVGELRSLGKEGKLTSDIVGNALLSKYDEIKRRSAELPQTVGGAWTQINNAFQQFLSTLEEKMGVFSALATTLGEVNKMLMAVSTSMKSSESSTLSAAGVARTFTETLAGIFDFGRMISQAFTSVGKDIGAVMAAIAQGARGNFSEATRIMKERTADLVVESARLKNLWSGGPGSSLHALRSQSTFNPGDESTLDARDLAMRGGGGSTLRNRGGGGGGGAAPKAAKTPADPSFMQYYEAALEEERRLSSEKDALREYSKQQELAYWRTLLGQAQLSSADRLAIQRKTAALEIEIRRQGATEQLSLDQQAIAQKSAMALGEVDGKRAAAQLLYANDQITKQQLIAMELEFHAQKYNIEARALQERLALLARDPNTSPLERQKLIDEQLQIEQKFSADRNKILGGLGEKKGEATKSDPLFGGMANSFGQSLEYMLLQAKTFQDGLNMIFKGIASVFLRVVVTEPLGQYVAGQAKMFAAKMGFLGKEETAQMLASGKTAAIKNTEATSVIGAESAKAGAGAAASQAGIPIIGPALAIGAMVAMVAAVMALKGKMKSAARGYDIPAGVNPMVQLHEQEMVLPSPLSQGLRNIIEQQGGGATPAGAGAGGGTTVIYAMDSQDVRRFMQKQGHRVADGLAGQARQFRMAPGF